MRTTKRMTDWAAMYTVPHNAAADALQRITDMREIEVIKMADECIADSCSGWLEDPAPWPCNLTEKEQQEYKKPREQTEYGAFVEKRLKHCL